MKKYIVKAVGENTYYCGFNFEWDEDISLADRFDTIEDAEKFIERESRGMYMIETVYLID